MAVNLNLQWQKDVEPSFSKELAPSYPQLDQEIRTVLPTNAAAHHLNRSAQTLRAWACLENGPIKPIRICGRLAWPVSEIRKLLKQGAV